MLTSLASSGGRTFTTTRRWSDRSTPRNSLDIPPWASSDWISYASPRRSWSLSRMPNCTECSRGLFGVGPCRDESGLNCATRVLSQSARLGKLRTYVWNFRLRYVLAGCSARPEAPQATRAAEAARAVSPAAFIVTRRVAIPSSSMATRRNWHRNGPARRKRKRAQQRAKRYQALSCPSWDRTRTLLLQRQACCQLHQGAFVLFPTHVPHHSTH